MLYRHRILGHWATKTTQSDAWVEFLDHSADQLRWLERDIFEQYYTPIDLDSLRDQARQQGILVQA